MVEKEITKMRLLISQLAISLVLFSCQNSYSQQSDIEYSFSNEVNQAINDKIASYQNQPEWKFYLTIGRVLYQDDCGNYQVFIGTYKDQPITVIESLINRSVHYYKSSEGLVVPIIFDYDYAFTVHGTDSEGRVIRKNVTGNDYFIEFTKAGKVVNTGY
jgi:hypothetical protein